MNAKKVLRVVDQQCWFVVLHWQIQCVACAATNISSHTVCKKIKQNVFYQWRRLTIKKLIMATGFVSSLLYLPFAQFRHHYSPVILIHQRDIHTLRIHGNCFKA